MKMWRAVFPLAFALLGAVLVAQEKPSHGKPEDSWQSLLFLIGTWEAKSQGGSAGATSAGAYTFQLELQGHILARHSSTPGCQGPVSFNCEHGDLLYIYRESAGQPPKAIYFDNEGHVIHYEVTTPSSDTAVFLSPASQPGPQYRLVYQLKGQLMQGIFQIRMPGQKQFASYLEWSGKRA
jgi:hypothetical protein